MGKYAHFENIEPQILDDLYTDHAEVARDIFQKHLQDFTGNPALTVDLVKMNAYSGAQENLQKLSEYDVVSVSTSVYAKPTEGSNITDTTLINGANAIKEAFEQGRMPVLVGAAGNDGSNLNGAAFESNSINPAVMDRASLIVGSARVKDDTAYAHKISENIGTTIAAENPMDLGEKYQYIRHMAPSLEGHEELVRDWILEKQADALYEAQTGTKLTASIRYKPTHYEGYTEIYGACATQYFENPAEIDAQIDHYMAHPEELHKQLVAELCKRYGADENGFTNKMSGTSFTAPYQAAFIAAAHEEQETRHDQGLPELTREEITALAKMSTFDTLYKGKNGSLMESFTNSAGNTYTNVTGVGIFRPDAFRTMLNTAYEKLETDPNIDREQIEITQDLTPTYGADHILSVSAAFNPEHDQDIIIESVKLESNYNDPSDYKQAFTVQVSGTEEEHDMYTHMAYEKKFTANEQGYLEPDPTGTGRQEWGQDNSLLGETLGKDGDITIRGTCPMEDEGHYNNLNITVYGYNKGGFMDQMHDHARALENEYEKKMNLGTTPEAANTQDAETSSVKASSSVSNPNII